MRPNAGWDLTMIVGDDGIGLPEGIDPHQTESLGLRLVATLTDQIDGRLEIDRSSGTEFRIEFRERKQR